MTLKQNTMGGSLQINELFEDIPEYMRKVFIETGTYKGVTCRMVSPHFEKVRTIEIFEPVPRVARLIQGR
jgi:hypothetical protein